jgi:hypothetical protein
MDPARPAVFISHSHRQAFLAESLARFLAARPLRVWLDRQYLTGSMRWAQEITDAIDRASHFLLIVSHESIDSDEVATETRHAMERGKPIIAVFYDRVALSGKLPAELGQYEHLSIVAGPKRFADIAAAVLDRLDGAGDAGRLPASRPRWLRIFDQRWTLWVPLLLSIAAAVYTVVNVAWSNFAALRLFVDATVLPSALIDVGNGLWPAIPTFVAGLTQVAATVASLLIIVVFPLLFAARWLPAGASAVLLYAAFIPAGVAYTIDTAVHPVTPLARADEIGGVGLAVVSVTVAVAFIVMEIVRPSGSYLHWLRPNAIRPVRRLRDRMYRRWPSAQPSDGDEPLGRRFRLIAEPEDGRAAAAIKAALRAEGAERIDEASEPDDVLVLVLSPFTPVRAATEALRDGHAVVVVNVSTIADIPAEAEGLRTIQWVDFRRGAVPRLRRELRRSLTEPTDTLGLCDVPDRMLGALVLPKMTVWAQIAQVLMYAGWFGVVAYGCVALSRAPAPAVLTGLAVQTAVSVAAGILLALRMRRTLSRAAMAAGWTVTAIAFIVGAVLIEPRVGAGAAAVVALLGLVLAIGRPARRWPGVAGWHRLNRAEPRFPPLRRRAVAGRAITATVWQVPVALNLIVLSVLPFAPMTPLTGVVYAASVPGLGCGSSSVRWDDSSDQPGYEFTCTPEGLRVTHTGAAPVPAELSLSSLTSLPTRLPTHFRIGVTVQFGRFGAGTFLGAGFGGDTDLLLGLNPNNGWGVGGSRLGRSNVIANPAGEHRLTVEVDDIDRRLNVDGVEVWRELDTAPAKSVNYFFRGATDGTVGDDVLLSDFTFQALPDGPDRATLVREASAAARAPYRTVQPGWPCNPRTTVWEKGIDVGSVECTGAGTRLTATRTARAIVGFNNGASGALAHSYDVTVTVAFASGDQTSCLGVSSRTMPATIGTYAFFLCANGTLRARWFPPDGDKAAPRTMDSKRAPATREYTLVLHSDPHEQSVMVNGVTVQAAEPEAYWCDQSLDACDADVALFVPVNSGTVVVRDFSYQPRLD